ncbi:pseudouridine synthase [Ferruginibacter yonginensis]|uniref:Pseudouridine synthase n=1 Tax=Ferruginibacter yonginensis TaxID=1310416 RepID=A0ABV8QRA8_9BACT
MSQDAFRKFINPKKNSVVKEEIRQEKKLARQEKRAFFEKKKEEEYKARQIKKGIIVKEKAPTTKAGKEAAKVAASKQITTDVAMPLNKFLAHCGICSRRDAIAIIAENNVKVNGVIVTEPGYKVQPTDEVIYNGKKLFITKNLVYILLNKPKDYITTTDDPQGRKTVLELIKQATNERVYPIGRLDRNTSGVLLLTNDGDLTQKLSHPSYQITKIYEVKLDKPLTKTDFDKVVNGLILEDGPVVVDSLAYADAKDKSIIGIEIHSGRNRIVRRIFESMGYDVKALDRVMYAGLTKKNVERSKWRYLSDKEIRLLKYMNESKGKAAKNKTNTTPAATTVVKKTPVKKGSDYTEAEIAEALGAPITPAPKKHHFVKVEGPKKPRKFKTHSEKKASKK